MEVKVCNKQTKMSISSGQMRNANDHVVESGHIIEEYDYSDGCHGDKHEASFSTVFSSPVNSPVASKNAITADVEQSEIAMEGILQVPSQNENKGNKHLDQTNELPNEINTTADKDQLCDEQSGADKSSPDIMTDRSEAAKGDELANDHLRTDLANANDEGSHNVLGNSLDENNDVDTLLLQEVTSNSYSAKELFDANDNSTSQVFITASHITDDTSSVFDVKAATSACGSVKEVKGGVGMFNADKRLQKQQRVHMSAGASRLQKEQAPETRNVNSRNTSHTEQESLSETVFQQAMNLMCSRCVSAPKGWDGSLINMAQVPYGPQVPQYFFVNQHLPMPVPPLKVWSGYNGNIYFEPMTIKRVATAGSCGHDTEVENKSRGFALQRHATHRSSERRHQTADSNALRPLSWVKEKKSGKSRNTQAASGPRKNSAKGIPTGAAGHHSVVLDKLVVMNPNNTFMQEELNLIESQKSTGSLAIYLHQKASTGDDSSNKGGGGGSKAARKAMKSANFDRICKGSVAVQLRRKNSIDMMESGEAKRRSDGNEKLELSSVPLQRRLMIVGDRFSPPSAMSPLLRTQTQFSLSSNRLTMNSPDPYSVFEHLPHLEQVRMSLRHMDSHGEDFYASRLNTPYSAHRRLTAVDDLKPFIKYSPDVKARYNKQLRYF